MEDPREDRILRKVVMGSIAKNIKIVDILDVRYFTLRPSVRDIRKFNRNEFLTFFSKMTEYNFPCLVIIEHKEQRVRVVIKPNF